MTTPARPLCQRVGCDQPVGRPVASFCSKACYLAHERAKAEARLAALRASLPICARPGCGQRVRSQYSRHAERKRTRYCSQACYWGSATHRQTTAVMRRKAQFTQRRTRFQEEVSRAPQRLTREDLLELLAAAYAKGYQAGYRVRRRYEQTRGETAA